MPSSDKTSKKSLYVAKSVGQLNEKANLPAKMSSSNAKVLVKTADKMLKEAEHSDMLGDEERAYVLFMKYFNVVTFIKKTADYKKQKDYYDSLLGQKNLLKAIDKAEALSVSLKTRYEEVEAEAVADRLASLDRLEKKSEEKETKQKEEKTDDVPAESQPEKAPENKEEAAAGSSSQSVSPTQLFNLLQDSSTQVLVMDVRPIEDFQDSHITHKSCVNIPAECITPGTTVTYIEKSLPMDSHSLWKQRGNVDHIVLIDWDSTEDKVTMGTPLKTLKDALFKFDSTVIIRSEPLVLDGGYKQWLLYYPMMTSNPNCRKQQQTTVPEANSTLMDFDYPDFDKAFLITPVVTNQKPELTPDSQSKPVTNSSKVVNGDIINSGGSLKASVPRIDRTTKPKPGTSQQKSEDATSSLYPSTLYPASSLYTGDSGGRNDNKTGGKGSNSDSAANLQNSSSSSLTKMADDMEQDLQQLERLRKQKQDELRQLEQEHDRIKLEEKAQIERMKEEEKRLNELEEMRRKEQIDVADLMRKKRNIQDNIKLESEKFNMDRLKKEREEETRKEELKVMAREEEEKRRRQEEVQRLRMERKKKEEDSRKLEVERKEQAVLEAEKRARESEERQREQSEERVIRMKKEEEEWARKEEEKAKLEKERLEKERLEKERQSHLSEEMARQEQDRQTKVERERQARVAEETARQERERQARLVEETARQERERQARLAEETARQEKDRQARLAAEKQVELEKQRQLQAKKEMEERERREQEEEKKRKEKEAAERLKAETAQREAEEKMRRINESMSKPKTIPSPNLPAGWEKRLDHKTNRYFYIDHNKGVTHWEPPLVADTPHVAPPGDIYKTKLKDEPTEGKRGGLHRSSSSPNIAKMLEDEQKEARKPSFPSVDRTKKPAKQPEPLPKKQQMPYKRRDLNPVYGNVGRALTGLRNLGNTCYMNSTIQCLNNTSPLVTYFLTDSFLYDVNRESELGSHGEVVDEFSVIVKALWSGQYRCLTPRDFKFVVGRHQPMFAGYDQQDSQEFLTFLLDGLHEGLNKVKKRPAIPDQDNNNIPDTVAADIAWKHHKLLNESIIVELFQGQLKSTLMCLYCRQTSVTFQAFMYLSLPIPSSSRCKLQDCVKQFVREEKMTGSSRWRCTRCKVDRDSVKKIDLWRLPRILLIGLNRFVYEGQWRQKINSYVDFPVQGLDLRTFVQGPEHRSYKLYGISNHYGTIDGGHYTAYGRNPCNQKWYKFDDHEVYEMSESDVKTSAAFVLYYTSIDLLPPDYRQSF